MTREAWGKGYERRQMSNSKGMRELLLLAVILVTVALASAQTPKLNIRTKNGLPKEEEVKQQMERLAQQYDLKKYTITRDIIIERGVIPHSSPVLTLNLRFLDDDDLALSSYLHEQGHWYLMQRNRIDNPSLLSDLERNFPGLDYHVPQGDGELRGSYFHIAVCMLEWQGMEELVGAKRARRVIEWKQGDHYKGIYSILLNQRERVESILNQHHVKW